MNNYILRTVDSEGNTVEESNLTLKEGSILIQHLPDKTSMSDAQTLHRNIIRGLELESEAKLITLYPNVKLQVLEIT